MSYRSQHMNTDLNFPRGGTLTIKVTSANFKEVVALIKSKGLDIQEDTQSYGNTKFVDEDILRAFFKCHFHLTHTSEMVGYAKGYAWPVTNRLSKVNVNDISKWLEVMLKSDELTREDLRQCLYVPRKSKRLSKASVTWSCRLIQALIKRCGSLKKAAAYLRCPVVALSFWLERK